MGARGGAAARLDGAPGHSSVTTDLSSSSVFRCSSSRLSGGAAVLNQPQNMLKRREGAGGGCARTEHGDIYLESTFSTQLGS